MGYGGWKTLAACANACMVLALLICLAERAAVAGFAVVLPLIAIAGYAEYRADGIRRKEGGTRVR